MEDIPSLGFLVCGDVGENNKKKGGLCFLQVWSGFGGLEAMVYCPRCGTKNEEDAVYCKNCGAPLKGTRPEDYRRQRDERCEEDCGGGPGHHAWRIFWGIIIILVGLAILWEAVLKNWLASQGYRWATSIEWGWFFGAIVAILVIFLGIRILTRR